MRRVLGCDTDKAWRKLETILTIESDADYRRARGVLDSLVDEIGSDERHPRAALMDTLATLIHSWEDQHHRIPAVPPRQVLGFLMKEHGLTQGDLREVGSQGIVSEVLAGKRDLNVRQIGELARRFGVSPAVFFPDTK